MKAESSQLIPQRLAANLEFLIASKMKRFLFTRVCILYKYHCR